MHAISAVALPKSGEVMLKVRAITRAHVDWVNLKVDGVTVRAPQEHVVTPEPARNDLDTMRRSVPLHYTDYRSRDRASRPPVASSQ